ncbi:aminoglycoside 6-adenylyltransferase [Amphibacillus xylanus]|uniref:Aminoglycoside adenylyltransferase n=1 Tax=Amphibacillus xylanus (strain ATCC 51415 / DSM 6626 / JCM 7361 / LMG 17667 / NBRC 15112 / Ep01) TaxID=698758 RepID=K0J1M0_AMPXN|nr:aminoglycoside 6-adenylyltransferase [Amphibacillus xylanus]BAM46376.1 aminoglycoside adenylyltransferase [Amphibacillus xylanus NBRC 15112]
MRTEKEMYDLVLNFAKNDQRVRAVGLNGSRTNPNAPRDIFQDYDVVYLVTEMESFLNQPDWIAVFGERLIMQTPEDMTLFPSELRTRYSYLMLFSDGNRIDLTLVPVEEADQYVNEDKLTKILLDKDEIFPELPEPTDQDYWVKQPTSQKYLDCCNEFWWITTYIAKGLWRREILYALDHLNRYGRPMLYQMLEWQVGIETDFSVSIGKSEKYLERYLEAGNWERLLTTFPNASYESVWQALFNLIDLFRDTATCVANHFEYQYPKDWDQNISTYLSQIKKLPHTATTFS